jgi:hypothetical protein
VAQLAFIGAMHGRCGPLAMVPFVAAVVRLEVFGRKDA